LSSGEQKKNDELLDTGNEDILVGFKITSDYLYDGTEVVQLKDLPFKQDRKILSDPEYVPGYIECKEQCTARKGICGAWSFDALNEICYIHNIDACCGQRTKREEELTFISGYNCPCCWSTYNECPCDLKERQECYSDATVHTAGAAGEVNTQSSSGVLLIGQKIKENRDLCACTHVLIKKRWRCIQPKCNKSKCQNPNRCRG